jgi:predicted Zn-dependent protease
LDDEELTGVIAHEIAHVILKHHEIHSYALKKKEKNNNVKSAIAQVAAGAVVTGLMMSHANSGARFTESNGEQYAAILRNSLMAIDIGFKRNTYNYRFSYSREQEIESDIIACLFLYWIGANPNKHIEALSLLGINQTDYAKEDDHPSIYFRTSVLTEYFNNASVYVNKSGDTHIVPKWKIKRYKEKYPDSKKANKNMTEKTSSNRRVFLSRGKYYNIPLEIVDDFLSNRYYATVLNIVYL